MPGGIIEVGVEGCEWRNGVVKGLKMFWQWVGFWVVDI